MVNNLAAWVILAWIPFTLILVGLIGPRRAASIAILGGYLFLPRYAHWDFFKPFLFDHRTVIGPSFLLGALIFDHRTVLRGRPKWLDLPMAAFVVSPLVGWVWHRFDQSAATLDQVWLTLARWGIPYVVGRLYFADADGPRRLARAIVVGGLAYVPVCWYETIAGPAHYLGRTMYGLEGFAGMVERLGGYRPEAFFGTGIEVATWMALTAVTSVWLWASGDGWRPNWLTGLASTALVLTTLACRGVYGYAEMVLGFVATAMAVGLRSKVLLIALMIVPPAYMLARGTGAWDGGQLREIARRSGKELTIGVRLETENEFVRDAWAGDRLFGANGRFPYWQSDGWWVSTLKGGGLVGLAAFYSAFFVPAGLVVVSPRRRFPAQSTEVGLALFLLIIMVDSLHNTSQIAVMPMIAGTLVSAFLSARPPKGPNPASLKTSIPIALIVTMTLLAIAEVIGRSPRSPGPTIGTHAQP